MGRIRKGRVGMPKIKKTKVEASSKDKKATAKAKKMPAEPPPPDSPTKPTPRLPAAASPGRKQLSDAKAAIKEAKRRYLGLKREATKLRKAHERAKLLCDQHAKSMQRVLGRTKQRVDWTGMMQRLSNAESRMLMAFAAQLTAELTAAHAWTAVKEAVVVQKAVEIARLQRRVRRVRVSGW